MHMWNTGAVPSGLIGLLEQLVLGRRSLQHRLWGQPPVLAP